MTRLAIFITASYLTLCSLASGQTEIITTVAGNGTGGASGDNGPATAAELYQPNGIAVDASGDLFIADTRNSRIRKVSSSGIITTFVGSGGLAASPPLSQPGGVAVDSSGNLFIADTGSGLIRKVAAGGSRVTIVAGSGSTGFNGDGGPATSATLSGPEGVAVDTSGNIFIADTFNNVIRKVAGGTISTVAGNNTQGFSGDKGPATSAQLDNPTGIFVDASGNLYIADRGNNRVRMVSAGGTITTIAGNATAGSLGDNGPATSAELYSPSGVAVDASGNIYIAATYNNRIREISGGIITTVAGNGARTFAGDGGPPTSAALYYPGGVALDASGDIFIADSGNNRIREVSASTMPAPSIGSGGIVPVGSAVSTIQPGEWVSIYGTNLAGSTMYWNGNFPTLLGGTTVMIDGNAAFLSFVSPGQINLQAPNDTSTGSVPVVVKTASGTSTSTVTLAQFAPSFFLQADGKHVAGIIVRPDGSYDTIGPTGNSLGYPTVAAKAGDSLELFAGGLGPTDPAVSAGQLFSSAAPTTNPVSLLIDNVNVTPSLSFAGLSEAGVYQINLTVPAGLGMGDVSLVATVGGVQTQSGVVISLQ